MSNWAQDENSRELAEALSRVYVRTRDTDFEQLLADYARAEAEFVSRVAGNEELITETKRRVAELRLYSAIEKRIDPPRCEDLFETVERLGYTSLEKKANVRIIYARYSGDTSILPPLRSELQEELNRGDSPLYHHLLSIIDSLRSNER